MANPACTEKEFVAIWKELGSCFLVSQRLGVSERAVYSRRISLEKKYGITLEAHNSQRDLSREEVYYKHDGRIRHTLNDGMCIVFSDAHYWPDLVSTVHRALLVFIKQFHPEIVVCNGDAFDGASISRYPRIGWDSKPTVIQEINAVKERLDEIEDASKGKLIWTLGNHDARYETFLAANSPQYEGVKGFTLRFIVGALRARRTVCLLLRIFRRPRAARAQKIISPHLIPYPTHFLKGVAKVALDCARRTSTFLSCAFCEQKGHLATSLLLFPCRRNPVALAVFPEGFA